MKYIALTLATLTLLGCQAQPPVEQTSDTKKVTQPAAPKTQEKAAPGAKKEVISKPTTVTPSGPKAAGPKAVAQSYELSDGTKIVSESVVRMMRFSLVKGYLMAQKAPKAIKFVLEGNELEGYHPTVRLSIYDPEQRRWQELGTVVAKGEVTKRYELQKTPAGTVAFNVHYFKTDPEGGSVRPNVFVKSVELEF